MQGFKFIIAVLAQLQTHVTILVKIIQIELIFEKSHKTRPTVIVCADNAQKSELSKRAQNFETIVD